MARHCGDPDTPQALRTRAAELLGVCAQTPDPEVKAILPRLAQDYLRRADEIEAASRGGVRCFPADLPTPTGHIPPRDG